MKRLAKRVHFLAILAIYLLPLAVLAQVAPPGPPQSKPIALIGPTAHIGNGQVIETAVILLKEGKIEKIVPHSDGITIPEEYQTIDVTGMHAYPGLILPNTDLGLIEISAINATNDRAEHGTINPNVRSIVAYNTDSEIIPTLRFNGVLMAQIAPAGGLICGSSSIVQLDAWNWEDAAYRMDDGLYLNWPIKTLPPRSSMGETEPRENEAYQQGIDDLTKILEDAKAYGLQQPSLVNIKLQALQGLFNGSQTLYIRTNLAPEILKSIQLAQSLDVKRIVLVGGSEALLVKDFLIEHSIPVVIGQTHRLPPREHYDVYQPYKLPFQLTQAGIKVCLGYAGRVASSRNLAFLAGTAAAYGLDKEVALKLVTSNTAGILGIQDRVGTLETNKDGTLVISTGDLLDMRTNDVIYAFIQGRRLILQNKQQGLYNKYKEKYENTKD